MKRVLTFFTSVAVVTTMAVSSNADLISEFEPNPAGGDPPTSMFELSGMAGAAFDLNILSIENDGFNGLVDRASNVTGFYDANGLAVVTIDDLENPSFTVLLTEFIVAAGTDLDPLDDGNLDVSALGTIFDNVGVSDSAADDATLYSMSLGGSSILYNGEFEPLGVFRDLSVGDFFQYVTVDFGGPDEHIGIFAANGGPELNPAFFSGGNPLATTYGAINPTFAIPEPGSFGLLGLVGLVAIARRRK